MNSSILTLEGSHLLSGLGRVEAQELGKLATVLSILVDTELDVLAERLVELVEVVLVLRNFGEQVETFLDDVLANDLQNLVLLEGFTGNIERKIFGVYNAFHKVEVFGDEVFTVIHNEDTSDVELDVIALLLRFEEIEWSTIRL